MAPFLPAPVALVVGSVDALLSMSIAPDQAGRFRPRDGRGDIKADMVRQYARGAFPAQNPADT
jgi:hypothetical protein